MQKAALTGTAATGNPRWLPRSPCPGPAGHRQLKHRLHPLRRPEPPPMVQEPFIPREEEHKATRAGLCAESRAASEEELRAKIPGKSLNAWLSARCNLPRVSRLPSFSTPLLHQAELWEEITMHLRKG